MSNTMSHLFDSDSGYDICVQSNFKKIEIRKPKPSELLLYNYPRSFYSQIVLMSLYYKNVRFTNEAMDIHKGDQFQEEFLNLNPRGEVPVLRCGITNKTITDSMRIINHLDEVFKDDPNIPKLHPTDPAENNRCTELVRNLHLLKLESLTFGSVQFPDLDLEPQGIYEPDENRRKMREYLHRRKRIFKKEAENFPQHQEALKAKLNDIEHDWHFLEKREDYEHLIKTFEKELDECEAELKSQQRQRRNSINSLRKTSIRRGSLDVHVGDEEEVPERWLCSTQFTVADICFAILLHRLYELGFYKRLIASRPHVQTYFERLRRLDSFKKAICQNTPRSFLWWILLIPLGTIVTFAIWGLIQGPPRPQVFTTSAQYSTSSGGSSISRSISALPVHRSA